MAAPRRSTSTRRVLAARSRRTVERHAACPGNSKWRYRLSVYPSIGSQWCHSLGELLLGRLVTRRALVLRRVPMRGALQFMAAIGRHRTPGAGLAAVEGRRQDVVGQNRAAERQPSARSCRRRPLSNLATR